MGIFDKFLGKGKARSRGVYEEDHHAPPPPEEDREDIIVDHEFVFNPEADYDRHVGSMSYRIRIENTGNYPLGAPKVEFSNRSKLGRFGEHEQRKGMVDPGKSTEIAVPFKPAYSGGKGDFEFQVSFFDFRFRSEERIKLKTEPLKVTVPKFKPLDTDGEGYRVLTSNLYRWPIETEIIEIPPKELFNSISDQLAEIGFHESNEIVNQGLFRGIKQFSATDDKGRKWAAQLQVIGKGKESKLLLYTYAERPNYAYNLATKILLKYPNRDKILAGISGGGP
jgi:hypothetical protein